MFKENENKAPEPVVAQKEEKPRLAQVEGQRELTEDELRPLSIQETAKRNGMTVEEFNRILGKRPSSER